MVNSSSGLRTVDALFEDEDFLEASFEGVDVEVDVLLSTYLAVRRSFESADSAD